MVICLQIPTTYLTSRCVDETIGDNQCVFRSNRSTTDRIFCIRQTLEKNGSTLREYIS
jgi:hypothetical protein